jgi:L-threonylcarbamoyladenylate synthase
MKTEVMLATHAQAISRALEVLKSGGVVAFPTDTVYGLGAPAFAPASIERLYEIKGREHTKAIAVLIADAADLAQVAVAPSAAAMHLAERFWPGPLTLVLRRNPELPAALSPNATIGVRVPDHAVARDLLRAAGPMAVTSANRSGGRNASSAAEVLAQLEGLVELLLDGGDTPGEVASTVVDVSGEQAKLLRVGPISEAAILSALSGE